MKNQFLASEGQATRKELLEIKLMKPEIIAIFTFILTMCFTPGPNNILSTFHTIKFGYKKTIPLHLGMYTGFTFTGSLVALLADWINQYKNIFNFIVFLGAGYILFLAGKIAFSPPINIEEDNKQKNLLGFKEGFILQFLNGKAWSHFTTLMTTVLNPIQPGLKEKLIWNFINSLFGLSALITWAVAGIFLKRFFSTPKQAKCLNIFLGLTLAMLGIYLIFP